MADDDLVTQKARASAVMILTSFSWNIMASAHRLCNIKTYNSKNTFIHRGTHWGRDKMATILHKEKMSSPKWWPCCPGHKVLTHCDHWCHMATEIWVNIEAETKWPPFCTKHFEVHFLQWKAWITTKISLIFVPKAPNDNMPALV